MDVAARPTLAGFSRTGLIVVGTVLLVISTLLGWALVVRERAFAIDLWWNTVAMGWATPAMTSVSLVMNEVGAGWIGIYAVPIAGAIALALFRGPWSALVFIVAEAASAGVVQILKNLFGRPRPEDILVISDYGSFPSGHVANAATLATLAFVFFPRLWVAILGVAWVLLMGLSRTYLHAHWLSDTIGGALIGVGTVLVLAGLFLPHLVREAHHTRARPRSSGRA